MTEYSEIQQIKEHDETAIIITMEIIFEIFGFFWTAWKLWERIISVIFCYGCRLPFQCAVIQFISGHMQFVEKLSNFQDFLERNVFCFDVEIMKNMSHADCKDFYEINFTCQCCKIFSYF